MSDTPTPPPVLPEPAVVASPGDPDPVPTGPPAAVDPWGNPTDQILTPPATAEAPEGMEDLVADETADESVHGYPFVFGGHTFRLRPQFDLRLVAALQRGNFDRALVLLLGRDQVETLIDLDTDEVFDPDRLREAVEIVAKRNGTTVGESSASSPS